MNEGIQISRKGRRHLRFWTTVSLVHIAFLTQCHLYRRSTSEWQHAFATRLVFEVYLENDLICYALRDLVPFVQYKKT